MRTSLRREGVSAATAACLFALVQGCAMQPTQTQRAPSYASTDSASSDPAPRRSQARRRNRVGRRRMVTWVNPYFRTVTSTSEGSVTVEGNTIHYHAVDGTADRASEGLERCGGQIRRASSVPART